MPISFGLAVEQLLADRRDDLHVDAGGRQPWQHAHEIERRARSLGNDVAVSWLPRREVADDVETLGGGPQIGVGERVPVGHAEVRACHLDDDDANLLLARGDLGGGEVAGGHVVVVPEAQGDDLITREQLPHLGSEDPEVRARVGGGLRAGVPGEDVQDPGAKSTVLVLLAPDAGGQVHQRREGAVGAAERPHSCKLVGVQRRALADQADGARRVARFLDRGLEPRPQGVGFGIVVAPDAAVLEVDRFREVGGQGQHPVAGDVVRPFNDLGHGPAGARRLARLAEQNDVELFLLARDRIPHGERLRLGGKIGDLETIVQEWVVLHVDAERDLGRHRVADLDETIGQPVAEAIALED